MKRILTVSYFKPILTSVLTHSGVWWESAFVEIAGIEAWQYRQGEISQTGHLKSRQKERKKGEISKNKAKTKQTKKAPHYKQKKNTHAYTLRRIIHIILNSCSSSLWLYQSLESWFGTLVPWYIHRSLMLRSFYIPTAFYSPKQGQRTLW